MRHGVEDELAAEEQARPFPRSRQMAALESEAVVPLEDETLDVLCRHRLLLLQARKGYRCNVDSVGAVQADPIIESTHFQILILKIITVLSI